MTINQILSEQIRQTESSLYLYTRMIIRSVAKELIGEDEDYRGHSAVNDFKAEQRLKVKEILSNLK